MTFVKRISAKLVDKHMLQKNILSGHFLFLPLENPYIWKYNIKRPKKNFPPINTFYDHSETLYTVRTKLQPKKKQLYSNSVHVLTITDNSSALKEGLLKFFPYSFLKFTYCFVGFFKRTWSHFWTIFFYYYCSQCVSNAIWWLA